MKFLIRITQGMIDRLKQYQLFILTLLSALLSKPALASNGDSPFPSIDIQDGDVVKAVGSQMQTGMKYALIGGGVLMILAGIGVIVHRLREDTSNKESGNFLVTLVIAGIAITIGIILLVIGWTAATYKVS